MPLQNLEPTTLQPPYESSTIKLDHETILSKINTNEFNECNTSVILLVDIEERGNNISRSIKTTYNYQNDYTSLLPSTYTINNLF